MVKLSSLFRTDAWRNVLSGLGMKKDKSLVGTSNDVDVVPGFPRLVDVQLESLYYTDGRVKNAVNIVAEKMMQNGFEVEGDDGTLGVGTFALSAAHTSDLTLDVTGGNVDNFDFESSFNSVLDFDFVGVLIHDEGVFVVTHHQHGFFRNHRFY
jgi:hypothetical protein